MALFIQFQTQRLFISLRSQPRERALKLREISATLFLTQTCGRRTGLRTRSSIPSRLSLYTNILKDISLDRLILNARLPKTL